MGSEGFLQVKEILLQQALQHTSLSSECRFLMGPAVPDWSLNDTRLCHLHCCALARGNILRFSR